jgi:hypothetical protein
VLLMNRVLQSDIRDIADGFIAIDRETSRELARKANALIAARKVTMWELCAQGFGTARQVVIDGWNAAGVEVLHARLIGL